MERELARFISVWFDDETKLKEELPKDFCVGMRTSVLKLEFKLALEKKYKKKVTDIQVWIGESEKGKV